MTKLQIDTGRVKLKPAENVIETPAGIISYQ